MKLLVLKISDQTFYAHHLSNKPGRIWYKQFKYDYFIDLPAEVDKLKRGDLVVYKGNHGQVICEDKICFLTWLKWEQGYTIEKYRDSINEISIHGSSTRVVYKAPSPEIRNIYQECFAIPMLNIA